MKSKYLDIMELSLSAYSDEDIAQYIRDVETAGLKEHGFPRLGANIGILMAHGRRLDLKDVFVKIMDLCCYWIPHSREEDAHFGNNFSIRELCCCFMLLEKTDLLPQAQLDSWKSQLRNIDPWQRYDDVTTLPTNRRSNWLLFAIVSEFVRAKYLGVDTAEFLDIQIACQLEDLDELGMYEEHNSPMCYEAIGRCLFAMLLAFGYEGRHKKAIEDALDRSAQLGMQMQSVTGELPFGGRSNQFLLNEAVLVSHYEIEAARFARKGDPQTAGKLKAAAALAADNMLAYLHKKPICHIKNRFPRESRFGCEGYAYFNKYMITAASNIYPAFLFADDTIAPTAAPATEGGYAVRTSDFYHKTFLNAGGYFLEFETDADFHYDANGLGRVQKQGCPGQICISVPFPGPGDCPYRRNEDPNFAPVTLCGFAGDKLGSEAPYRFLESRADDRSAEAAFFSESTGLTERYHVSAEGVKCTLSGAGEKGFMIPAFEFDGKDSTVITAEDGCITVSYEGSRCIYRFDGKLDPVYQTCSNRNGIYRVYKVYSDSLEIEIVCVTN